MSGDRINFQFPDPLPEPPLYTQAQVDAMLAAERERCAEIAEIYEPTEPEGYACQCGRDVAARIRSGK